MMWKSEFRDAKFLLRFLSVFFSERIADLPIMNLPQKELTTRTYEPLDFTQRRHEETMLHAAENAFLNWNIIRGITLTHVIMKTQETTGTTETPLNKTSENTHIYRENERESGSVLKPTVPGGAHHIPGVRSLPQYQRPHLSVLLETLNGEFTASLLKEVVA